MTKGIKLSQSEINERNRQFELGRHWCTACLRFRAVEEFAKSKNTTYGLNHQCRDCHKEKRNHVGQRSYLNKRNRKLSAYFTDLAGGCCQRCGYSGSVAALDFHHVNPSEKSESTATAIISGDIDRAKREVDKCALICSNCHREFNAGLWRAEFIKRSSGLGWTIKRGSIVETRLENVGELPLRYQYSQLKLV